ncbi:MAG: hypothetical protein LUG47_10620, partial [Clostridiales bacterium]|nr:hypothetical protein [Clostridiales bacterium]
LPAEGDSGKGHPTAATACQNAPTQRGTVRLTLELGKSQNFKWSSLEMNSASLRLLPFEKSRKCQFLNRENIPPNVTLTKSLEIRR